MSSNEIEMAVRKLNNIDDKIVVARKRAADLEAENARLTARIKRLEEALKPFAYARMAEGWGSFGDNTGLPFGEGLTIGDFRRARAAYNGEPEENGVK